MDSFNHFQSDYYPEHVEAGTRNMTGIASLKAGVFYLMKYQDEFSIKEISESLEIGESATKMRLNRAKSRLLKIYNAS